VTTYAREEIVRPERESPDPEVRDVGTELWKKASARLQEELSDGHFSAWFQRAEVVGFDGGALVVSVPSRFAKEWIESRYLAPLQESVVQAAGRPIRVSLIARSESPEESDDLPPSHHGAQRPVASFTMPPSEEPPPQHLHPKYSFESFVIGPSNRFAHAAALAAAEAPAQAYNPLFIYGGSGLGKTHLLQAIGRYVQQFHSGLVIRYVSTEQFTNEFIASLQRRTIPAFHRRYRAADVLLIDDIHFLEGKESTQEEFFHTFNALHPGSQIIISSDRPPKKIPTLEERLRTRFEWGLITDIQPPDLETRIAILHKKIEADHLLEVPPDVLSFIASRIQTNIRELEGALIRVAAYASLTRSEITLELAEQVLQSLLPNSAEARVTSDLVISVAAEYFDLTPDEIRSPNRSRPLVDARQIAMYLCRELTDLSLPNIGDRFGGRDHSTVLHATNKVKGLIRERQSAYEQVQELTTRIRQRAARG
jgi:chromosomal replication initiator protein